MKNTLERNLASRVLWASRKNQIGEMIYQYEKYIVLHPKDLELLYRVNEAYSKGIKNYLERFKK